MSDDRAYRILVAYDPEKQNFVARVPELDVETRAATRAEALAEAEIQIEQRIAGSLAEKRPLPPPIDTLLVGGTLTVQIADALHRDLLHHARSNGMSVEEYAGQLIARAIGALDGMGRWGRERGSQRPAPAQRDPDAQPQQRDDRGGDNRGNDNRGNRAAGPDRGAAGGGDRGGNRGGDRGGDRGGGNRGRQREGYRPELDDKANFLEYLRGLEKGGGQGGGGRGRR